METMNECSDDQQPEVAEVQSAANHDHAGNIQGCSLLCNLCKKGFSCRGNLNKHYKIVHKQVNPEEVTSTVDCLIGDTV